MSAEKREGRSNMGNTESGETTYKRRWYDEHEGLSSLLERLRTADKIDRDNILEVIKKIITKKDPHLMEWVYTKFPPNPQRERWYDEDPHLWLVVNSLRYADDETIEEVIQAINGR